MSSYDEKYLLKSIDEAGMKNVKIIKSDDIKQTMIDKFVDFSRNCHDSRYFLNFVDKGLGDILFGNSYCLDILRNNPQTGHFYLFAEDSKSCLILNNWNEVIQILDNLPYMNVYIMEKSMSYVISVTEEDNMIYEGIEFNL